VKVIDTDRPIPDLREHHQLRAGQECGLEAYSMMVLRRVE
jgi:hypothetical protein